MEESKINAIRKYLSHNDVKYYDVQAELIDHFATAVENIEREYPEISFKEALHKAHRGFGGSEGFAKYLKSAEKAVEKKTLRLMGKTLVAMLKWPYFIFTLGVVICWSFILSNFHSEIFTDITFFAFCGAYLLVLAINYFRLRKVSMFLPKRSNAVLGWILYFIFYLTWVSDLFGSFNLSTEFAIMYFSLLSINLVTFLRIPDLAIQETKKIYPRIAA